MQQVRNSIFQGNQATLNVLSGFLLNGIQNCALTGQQASKNGAHGRFQAADGTVTDLFRVEWEDNGPSPGLVPGPEFAKSFF